MTKLIVDSCVFINAFKSDSEFREDSLKLLEHLARKGKLITMPAHGWFEILCSLRRVERKDHAFEDPQIDGLMKYPVELIHIDENFISRYGNVDIPYIKAGDHIFIVIAYINNYQLITWDHGMKDVAEKLNIQAYTPTDYLALSQRE